MSFFHDIATDLHLQRIADATRRAFATAALTATGQKPLADLVASIASQHPHLTPGITLALANAGYGPNDPLTQSASALAAQRKIQNGIGWNSIGDNVNPTHAGLLDIPGIHFPEAIGTTLAAAANGISTAIDKTAKTISAPVAPTLRIIGATALSGGQLLDAAVRRVATNSPDNSLSNELLETTLGQSVKSLAGGHGLALGHGFLPTGPATAAATAASASTQSLTYADHPYFSLHDDPNVQPSPHVATTGRVVAKTITEPGSPLFNLVSGLIDAAKTIALDPVSKVTETLGEAGEARKPFSPTNLGPSTPQVGPPIDPFENPEGYKAQQLLIEGNRKTIATVPVENYLTQDPVGIDTVNRYAAHDSAYQIWRMSGGMSDNMNPAIAHSLSQVSTPEEVRGVLGSRLGIDLLDKPATTRLGLAATDLGIRDRLDSIRLFNNVPDPGLIDVGDHQQMAKQLVLHLRNAKAPQELVESSFNKMAAAATDVERKNVWHDALNIDLPHHIATTDLAGPVGSLDRNFARLMGAYQDETAWDQITRAQIANKNPIMGVMLDGQEFPLRSPYHDAEAINRTVTAPDIREIRRVTSTYGRLLVLSHAEVPLEALDWLQSQWTKLSIARISTTLRIVGQSQVEMAARGLDTPFGHLLDYFGIATGRKLGTDILGEELTAAKAAGITDEARNIGTTSWANDLKQARREVIPYYDPRFATGLADDIYNLHIDPVARRIAGYTEEPFTGPTASNLPQLYHGSPQPVDFPTRGLGQQGDANLFGPGFYTTDEEAVAKTYARPKSVQTTEQLHSGYTYGVKYTGEFSGQSVPRILDLEETLPKNLQTSVGKFVNGLSVIPDDAKATILQALSNRTGADAYDEIVQALKSADPPLPQYVVNETLSHLNTQAFADNGVDAFRYEGGVRTGSNINHNAYVFLKPEDLQVHTPGVIPTTGNPIADAKTWLASDAPDAVQYRLDNGITPDNLSSYVQNLSNTIKTKTLSQDSLMSAIRDGEHAPGSPIYTQNDQGARHLTAGFKNHINSLVEKGLTPDETIGEILPRVSDQTKNLYTNVLDKWLNKVLIGPINNWVSNPAIRQYYYQELAHTLPLMTEDAQATALKAASEAGLDAKSVTKLASVAAQRAGDLTVDEGNVLTTSRATRELKRTLYDMHDRKQILDIMRLIFPFGNAWAQQLKEWAELVKDRPNIIPRAETLIHGAEGSGFFFIDPKSIQYDANGKPIPGTGTESFGYPGSAFVTKLLTGAPFTLSSPVSSLNMFSQNPLMPGFGPIAQTAIGHIIPDKPQFLELKKMVAPFGTPEGLSGFVPSYLKKVQTAFSSPDSDRAFANTVMDTAKYLESTGRYDLNSTDDQIKLEDAARSMAKRIYLFRSVAQFALPSSPTPDDVVKDASGQSVLTFKMSQDYYDLVNDDKLNHTNLAVSRFLDEYGTKNILGMQSITQGDSPLNSKGYAWVLDNPDIARKYADVYSYFAPAGGGRSQQAYDMLFDKGKRKILSVSEAMQAANARVATMIYDNLKQQLGPKRTEAQSQWLESKKALLIQKYPGWNPDYVGTKTPQRIRQLQDAANDPKLANNPVTPALQAYFHFRDQAAQAAGIVGWNTAATTKPTRDWLRAKAAFLASRVPEFQGVFDDLLSRELKDDG